MFGLLGLLLPVMLLVTAVQALGAHGPGGWLLALLLVVAIGVAAVWLVNRVVAWWRSTKAPEQA